ncbi:hypothetical protein [Asticcacaulis sp. AND118]|uniref:hypothetical protein n=1 Tax=Asticcacaulis sp. AND118 TaxID=2840468 RepID=UPI001CFF54A8|nr:hypothetical protein [Asticcacaulis sp. AND118]UDF04658.1 hypothetical protein LH365_06355 [Asticcacaulis sp. AND118]
MSDVEDLEVKIIEALSKSKGHLTRNDLWKKLPTPNKQPTQEYWPAEQSLVDKQKIVRRRGHRGGIYLVDQADVIPTEVTAETIKAANPETKQILMEREYYDSILGTIISNWTLQPGFTHVYGAVTAGQGRRQTGGRWTRPDIVICTVSEWLFSSRPEGDVRTFEVKRFEALDVLAVYEALSHKSKAHYAYLLIVNVPERLSEDQKADLEGVLSVAGKHGIGVITAKDPNDWSSWEFELDATRSDADHQAINQMLLDQVPPDVREHFHRSLRTVTVHI